MDKKPTYDELEKQLLQLEKTVTFLKTLVNLIPVVLLVKDPEGAYLFCNSRYEDIIGVKEKEAVGKTDYDFFDKELADSIRKADMDIAVRRKAAKSKKAVRFSDGHKETLDTIKAPIFKDDGSLAGILHIGYDITALHDTETAAHDPEETFRTIFENMALGCCLDEIVYDTNGYGIDYRILDVNPVYEKLIGISRNRAIGELASVLYESGEVPNMDIYNTVDKTGEPITFEAFFPPTGRHLYITASRISKGRFCTIFSDITERLKLEEQLQQAQKMESIGRLSGGVAHDFNNMLGVILGHAELAMNAVNPGDKLHSHLKAIINASHHSSDIIRQLLAFARKQTISPKSVNINRTVESMFKMLKHLIGENIDLVWEPKQELQSVKMDPSQIDQILANLCVNAKDAVSGNGKITIRTDNVILDEAFCANNLGSAPGEYVLLEVGDDGCGMSNDTLSKIFEPFFTTKEAGKGTGLGLSTVFGIVKQNNGFIYTRSKIGQGTTFSIYLPQNKEKAAESVAGISDEIIYGHGETILVVEDEEINLEMINAILEKLDYNVLTAGEPAAALALAENYQGDIDLLITDVIMPGMNGNELSTRMQKVFPSIKTLFMSGYTADIIVHQGMLEEGANFIQKPFTTQVFSNKIKSALES